MKKVLQVTQHGKNGQRAYFLPVPDDFDEVAENTIIGVQHVYDKAEFNQALQNVNYSPIAADITIKTLLQAGRRVEAVQFIRHVTKWGLYEAKTFADSYAI
jgi:ribosomal protein L7/L12